MASQPSAEAVLKRYIRAERRANVRGVVLTVSPTATAVRTTSRKVVRRSDGRSLSVFETPASQKGVIIADDGVWTTRYDPKLRIVRKKRSLDPPSSADHERQFRLIQRNYHVRLDGAETVAGRTCDRLSLQPRFDRDLTVRLWVDRATGVELRRDEVDGSGSTICIVMYTSVSFPSAVKPAEVTPRFPKSARVENISRSGIHRDVGALARVAGFAVRAPLSTPQGFEFAAGTAATIAGRSSAFLRYTDGLSEITIIETPAPSGKRGYSRAARIVPRPYGEVEVNYVLDDLQVVVVGRGDARELLAAAEALDMGHETAWRREVARTFNGSSAAMSAMRNRGLTGETTVALLTLSAQTGKPAESVMRSYLEGWCWRDLAKRWRVPEATIQRNLSLLCSPN